MANSDCYTHETDIRTTCPMLPRTDITTAYTHKTDIRTRRPPIPLSIANACNCSCQNCQKCEGKRRG